MHKLGIDLGGTKIEGILLDPHKATIERFRIDTQQEKGYRHILNRIKETHDRLAAHLQGEPYSIGFGTPGAKAPDGTMMNSSLLCLNGERFEEDISSMLDHPVGIENDANCFAMAEAIMGAGKGKRMVFGMILGTGVGGGLVYDEKLIKGAQDIAGEWGHSTIDPHGADCFCGKKGCVERYISGTGVEERYEEQFGERITFKEIVQRFRNSDENATVIMNQFLENFGRAVSNVINIIDPDMIVLGGGVSNIDELYTIGIEEIKRFIFCGSEPKVFLKRNIHGDSAGVYGAALIGL